MVMVDIRALRSRKSVLAAAVGSVQSVHEAVSGGADFVVFYNSRLLQAANMSPLLGLMPIGNANHDVLAQGDRFVRAAGGRPVFAGVAAWDPTIELPAHLDRLGSLGYAGVLNFPTVGWYDGAFRRAVEKEGLGFAREAELIRAARTQGMAAVGMAFTAAEGLQMADAGADFIVAATPLAATVPEVAAGVASIAAEIGSRPDIALLCHGGALREPDDVLAIRRALPSVDGFLAARVVDPPSPGGSVRDRVAAFKQALEDSRFDVSEAHGAIVGSEKATELSRDGAGEEGSKP
jgi:predicted TIM-barrel enzyme